MRSLPGVLGAAAPVHVAPMAGGPSTPALVSAAGRAGHLAQLAGGYLDADALAAQVAAVRSSGTGSFGVNLFVPAPVPVDDGVYEAYRAELEADAGRPLPSKHEDDDAWSDKLGLLLDDPVPVVSFTFGIPAASVVNEFRRRDVLTVQSVTSVTEARAAAERGVDVLLVQGEAAGGHSAVLDAAATPAPVPLQDLVRRVTAAVRLPVVAAGGLGTADAVRAQLDAGAAAVAVGTAVLRTDEAGTSATHRAALTDRAFDRTVVTRAFTGRPARSLANAFTRAHPDAPLGYPALHHLTRPIRSEAAAVGDPHRLHLWAGRGWRAATDGPVTDALAALLP
ncbi:nitronate monooxygenase [Curtobacterium sp. RHCJP20]|uniref:Propionate 3-nitronate monooxygenase n=1 Tax=Curtobacterium subtropicum TaxID=3055138 RepID=A0ABT7TDD1_9MICO|nr:nitronate monooxygenase [Curtobacterium subtropicum]MDM7887578.1 nitronate monooxygenase [Curtobacterium subtropicum]